MDAVTRVRIAVATRRGRESNVCEDAVGIDGWALQSDDAPTPPWLAQGLDVVVPPHGAKIVAVADGVGGRVGGQAAALLAAERLTRPDVAATKERFGQEIGRLHHDMHRIATQRAEFSEMGATVAGIAILGSGRVAHFNVGDTRCYQTTGADLVQLSRDDSVPLAFSTRTRLGAWIGQADVDELDPWVQVLPSAHERRFLLCTDGLYASIGDINLLQAVMAEAAETVTPLEQVNRLMAAAMSASDDATAVVVHVSVRVADQGFAPPPEGVPQDGKPRRWKLW